MTRTTVSVEIFPAIGGLQTANNPALIPKESVSDMNNIIFTNDSSKRTRPGKLRLDSETTEVEEFRFLFDFWFNDPDTGSQTHQIVKIADGVFYADGGADFVFEDKTGSTSIVASDVVVSDVFENLLMITSQNTEPKGFLGNGTLKNLGGSPRNGSLIRSHAGYAFLSGIRADPHAIDRSYAGDCQTWTGVGTETIYVREGDGDPVGITALFPSFNDVLYVAKRRSIYAITQPSAGVFAVADVVRGLGCVSHNSVVAVQNDIIYCSERGVHSLVTTDKFGNVESTFLSAKIHDIYNDDIDFSRAEQIQAAYIPEFNSYIMTVPIKGSYYNRDAFGYNISVGEWYRFKEFNAQILTSYTDENKKTRLMIGDKDGRISILDTNTKVDFGSEAINSSFKTGIIFPNGIKNIVSFKSITCLYKPQGISTFQVTYSVDGNEIDTVEFDQTGSIATPLGPQFILGVAKLGNGAGQIKTETKELKGNGRGIQLTFNRNPGDDDLTQGLEILGYMIEVEVSGPSEESTSQ